MCFVCVFPPEKNECAIDVYFTIDTSETIALQEPPPGALVESIKVPLQFHQHKIAPFHGVVIPEVGCHVVVLLYNVFCLAIVDVHRGVCTAFTRRRTQRCCEGQLEHRWTALLPETGSVQSHRTQG